MLQAEHAESAEQGGGSAEQPRRAPIPRRGCQQDGKHGRHKTKSHEP